MICDTLYFGGMLISMWMWSGHACAPMLVVIPLKDSGRSLMSRPYAQALHSGWPVGFQN